MKPFLKELAEKMMAEYPVMDHMTFVFPNRRAALYFQNYLSQGIRVPQWAPQMMSIEEFFRKNTSLEEPDKLTLIYKLYQVYSQVLKTEESFDRFFFWGEMLLRDFDEMDKYLVDAVQLFKDLSKLKELDETFDYLSEEQKKFLMEFWVHFEEKPSITKEEFLRLWKRLPKVYTAFTKQLKKEGLGYEGMIHREVVESMNGKTSFVTPEHPVVFAGFNALTRAEEVLIGKMVKQGARIFWDLDDYYVSDPMQEAGQFLRQYRKHPQLSTSFKSPLPGYLFSEEKKIELTGVPQRMGQAKLSGEEIRKILEALPGENLPTELSKTVIVLPDESMLLPVMHSLPVQLEDINVTMGFPLRFTPLFNLVDQVIEMQVRRRKDSFSHREVTSILGHAYVLFLAPQDARHLSETIIKNNRVYVSASDLNGADEIFNYIFKPVEPAETTAYLLELIRYLGARFTDKNNFDREYAYHFHQHIARLHVIFTESNQFPDWRGFQKLFRQIVISQKIPFRGEPLRGLQIMGVLETRNLDFDNVIVLSMNEGLLPAPSRQGSYIPHTLRKAYSLPTFEHQDAIYAYLFYRLLQRAQNIHFYYNTEPDVVGNGEMSRYLQQLLLESKLPVKRSVLHNPVHVHKANQIDIHKSDKVMAQLAKYVVNETGDAPYKLTPSNLNDFIDCGLRFYLRHIARLSEVEEVDEDVDARVFGNIVHDVMGWFYQELRKKKDGIIEKADLANPEAIIEQLIDRAFRKLYRLGPDDILLYEGQRVVVKEIARTFVRRIIEMDALHAPFEVTMVEEPFAIFLDLVDQRKIKIGGTIDRADRKDGSTRVIDYKTGKDDLNFDSISSLFERNKKRNKAALQTLLYALVYQQKTGTTDLIQPGLMNRKSLFGTDFVFGHSMGKGNQKTRLNDIRPYLTEFSVFLQQTVEDLYNPEIPFSQTTDEKNCTFCPYRSLCRR